MLGALYLRSHLETHWVAAIAVILHKLISAGIVVWSYESPNAIVRTREHKTVTANVSQLSQPSLGSEISLRTH